MGNELIMEYRWIGIDLDPVDSYCGNLWHKDSSDGICDPEDDKKSTSI